MSLRSFRMFKLSYEKSCQQVTSKKIPEDVIFTRITKQKLLNSEP